MFRLMQLIRSAALLTIIPVCLAAFALTVSAAQPADPNGGHPLKPVQVFDVAQGKVIHTFDNDDAFQAYARGWLDAVTGVSPKVQPEEKCGYIFRVPLRQPMAVNNAGVRLNAVEVFMFYCPGEQPRLLAIDTSRKAYFLEFKSELGPFLAKTGVPAR